MAWLRNKYGGWFEIPDEDYVPSKNEDLKEKQIAKTKAEAEKLNNNLVKGNSVHDYQKAIREATSKEQLSAIAKEAGNTLSKDSLDKVMSSLYDRAKVINSKNEELKEKQIAKNEKERNTRSKKPPISKTLIYGNTGDRQISNIAKFLREQSADEIVVRSTYVRGGWYDIEFDANRAGFNISRNSNDDRFTGFKGTYIFTRKSKKY